MEAKIREAGCYGPNPDPFWPIAEQVVIWLPVPSATEVVSQSFVYGLVRIHLYIKSSNCKTTGGKHRKKYFSLRSVNIS